jgi:hypothetical protein
VSVAFQFVQLSSPFRFGVVQRPADPASKPVSLFDLGRFFVPTRAAAVPPRAAAVKVGRRGAPATPSAVARPHLDGGEHGVTLRAVRGAADFEPFSGSHDLAVGESPHLREGHMV